MPQRARRSGFSILQPKAPQKMKTRLHIIRFAGVWFIGKMKPEKINGSYKDLLITGARVSESEDAAPGHIRAYDALTGKLRWIFHTIPHPGEKGFDTWPKDAWTYTGGANHWPGMAVDAQRGIVYVT